MGLSRSPRSRLNIILNSPKHSPIPRIAHAPKLTNLMMIPHNLPHNLMSRMPDLRRLIRHHPLQPQHRLRLVERMDRKATVLQHLQEYLAQVLEQFVVERQAAQHFVVGVFERELGKVAGEQSPGRGGAAAVRGPEEDYAAGGVVEGEVLRLVSGAAGIIECLSRVGY